MIEQPGAQPARPPAPQHTRVVRNTLLSMLAIAMLGASRLLYNVVAGRSFGPAALGEATLAINAAMFASLLVSGGWQISTARYVAQSLGEGSPGQAASVFRRTLAHNTAGGVTIGVLTWLGLSMLPGVGLTARDAALAGLIAFAYNAYQHAKSASYGFGHVRQYASLETFSSLLLVAGVAIVAAASERAWLLVPVTVAYGLFSVAAVRRVWAAAGAPDALPAERWREIQGFTLIAIAGTVASAGFLNLTPVFAGRYDSPRALGLFAAALALVVPVYFLPRALSLALFPSIAYRYGQQRVDEVARQLEQSGRGVAVLLLAPTAIGATVAGYVLRVVFGEEFAAGGPILAVMLGATYLSVAQIPFVTALSATERRWYKVPMLASAAGLAVGLVVWLIAGPRYGAEGIAWGYLIGSVPQAAIPVAFAARVFGLRLWSLVARAAAVWGAAAVVAGAAGTASPGGWAIVAAVYAVLFAPDLAWIASSARAARRRPG